MYNKDNLANIGLRIMETRKDAHITLEELGKKVGMEKSGISRIETGKQVASIDQLADFANALDTNIENLLGIDRDEDFIRFFIKSFKRVTTTNKYSANNGGVYNADDLIFQTDKDYLVFTGKKSLFALIKKMAEIENQKSALTKIEYKNRLYDAKEQFKKEEDKTDEESYFLISGEQMTTIIESAVKNQVCLQNLIEESNTNTPLEG